MYAILQASQLSTAVICTARADTKQAVLYGDMLTEEEVYVKAFWLVVCPLGYFIEACIPRLQNPSQAHWQESNIRHKTGS
jgi:hypothetical protein